MWHLRRVVGPSMEPLLREGQLLLVGKPRKLRTGQVIIFGHEGVEKVKRITQLRDDAIFVEGDNPDRSTDSRMFGWIDRQLVTASVIWPRL